MRMKAEHFASLKALLDAALQCHRAEPAPNHESLHASKKVAIVPAGERPLGYLTWANTYNQIGLTPKRARWDLFWATDASARRALIDEVYQYCDDDHIDTALRKIFGHKA